jgi:hypothetical protein
VSPKPESENPLKLSSTPENLGPHIGAPFILKLFEIFI